VVRSARTQGSVVRDRGEAGFTFLEILLVVGIIAVAATLRTMQSDAVISGRIQRLIIDPRANELRVEERDASFHLGDATQLTTVRGGEIDPSGLVRVNFYPNGSTSGLDVVIDDRETPGDVGFLINLDPLIGVVTIRDEPQ
jgi:hypothetical protein